MICLIGWNSIRLPSKNTDDHFLSVIVPARNEAGKINRLLESLKNQTYRNFEVIVVDDHSEDQTVSHVSRHDLPNLKLITNNGSGKKAALTSGIKYAGGEIIVTTDADCWMNPLWLEHINSCFTKDVVMVVGPVALKGNDHVFENMQAIEFSSLIGCTGALSYFAPPIMCNGANLSYRKECFTEVSGYAGNENIASGDDEFLMRKFITKYKNGVRFGKNQDIIVYTSPLKVISQLLMQRRRWASKWKANTSVIAMMVASLIFFTQVTAIVAVAACIWFQLPFLLMVLLFKLLLEMLLLRSYCRFLKVRFSGIAFLGLQIIYPVYVIYTAVSATLLPYHWKGRKYAS